MREQSSGRTDVGCVANEVSHGLADAGTADTNTRESPTPPSFVLRYTDECDRTYVSYWNVTHAADDPWNERVELGVAFFAEVEELAARDERTAYDVMHLAVAASNWSAEGWGEETGFARQMAGAAIVGLRAIRAGWSRDLLVDGEG